MYFSTFCHQIELILKDRNLLLQATFDSFDFNNDNKISELDLFKFILQSEKSYPIKGSKYYTEMLLKDICQMRNLLSQNWGAKLATLLKENQGN